ncbi:MAG: hypothetical protein WCM76_03690 [Bacteroidota bacterium]
MKGRKAFVMILIAIFASGAIFTSCKKDNTSDDSNKKANYRSAQDNSTADNIFSHVFNEVNKGARYTGSKNIQDTIQGCPVTYITPGGFSYPKTITLDFGTACTGTDGIIRSGKIISTISAPYIDSNSVVTSTLQNFHEIISGKDYSVTGTEVITNLGHNQAGHPIYSVNVTGASVTSTDGTISWTSTRQNEWFAGYNTYMNWLDDEYRISGSANGVDINGATFTVNITLPLEVQVGCWYIKKGKIDIINPGYATITVDYGDGTCDNIIYVVINGVTYTVVVG